MTEDPNLHLRIPAAVVRLALVGNSGTELPLPAALLESFLEVPGTHQLDPKIFAICPVAGDEAVFDVAARWASDLEGKCGDIPHPENETSEGVTSLAALIFPGIVRLSGNSAALMAEPLFDDLKQKAPDLPAGIFLSGRATNMLETPLDFAPAPAYLGLSGKGVSLYRLVGAEVRRTPWRNPEVFGTSTPYVTRPGLENELAQALQRPLARVSGPLGYGKTRLVREYLDREKQPFVWLRTRPGRISSPSLAEQTIRGLLLGESEGVGSDLRPTISGNADRAKVERLLEKGNSRGSEAGYSLNQRAVAALDRLFSESSSPVVLAIDDAHMATGCDADLIAALIESASSAGSGRIILLGRSGAPWPLDLESLPTVDVPSMTTEEMSRVASSITRGLSLPESVQERFLDDVQGNPFAFEEGLFALIHERHLRQVYGSFFFGGSETTEFQPSHRLARHVEAETARLGPTLPLRILSLVEEAAPATELASTATMFGEEIGPEWEQPFLTSGILRSAESPWGAGVEIGSPVVAGALARTFTKESATVATRQLGELLSFRGESGEACWASYRMLSGTGEAVESLLKVFKTPYATQIPRPQLVDALTTELRALETSPESESTQLQLLWRLLPLARRMGRLGSYAEDLERGIELARKEPEKLLALAGVKAEMEQAAGSYAKAETTIQSALKAAANVEAKRKARLMIQLGRLFLQQNRFVEAEQLFGNLKTAFDTAGSRSLAATCLFHLGNIALRTGRLDEAASRHQESLEIRRDINLPSHVGSSLTALGATATAAGNYPLALRYYEEARGILEEHGREAEVAFALLGAARTLSQIGDFTAATGLVRLALALREGRDDTTGEAIARLAVARNYLDIGRPDTALEEARKAHFQLSLVSADASLADANRVLGEVHRRQRRYEDARRRLEHSLAGYRDQDNLSSAAFVIAALIEVCLSLDDADGVRTYTTELKNALKGTSQVNLREILHLRLYRGLDWLARHGHKVGNPSLFLERAYRSVLRKAGHLTHDVRQRYLFQVPEICEIVEAATRLGLDQKVRQEDAASDDGAD